MRASTIQTINEPIPYASVHAPRRVSYPYSHSLVQDGIGVEQYCRAAEEHDYYACTDKFTRQTSDSPPQAVESGHLRVASVTWGSDVPVGTNTKQLVATHSLSSWEFLYALPEPRFRMQEIDLGG